MSETFELEDIKRLTLSPDDLLVIRYAEHVSTDHMVRLTAQLRAELPHHNKVLVLDGGAALDVLTQDDIADHPDG